MEGSHLVIFRRIQRSHEKYSRNASADFGSFLGSVPYCRWNRKLDMRVYLIFRNWGNFNYDRPEPHLNLYPASFVTRFRAAETLMTGRSAQQSCTAATFGSVRDYLQASSIHGRPRYSIAPKQQRRHTLTHARTHAHTHTHAHAHTHTAHEEAITKSRNDYHYKRNTNRGSPFSFQRRGVAR